MKVTLKNVRLSFPQVFEAKAMEAGQKPAYSAAGIMAPGNPGIDLLNQAINAVGKEKWNAKADANLKALRASGKVCLHDGDTKAYDGFAGNMFVQARAYVRPQVRDRDGQTPLTEADGRIYPGCYVNMIVDVWAQDNSFGKRVNASLLGIQFVRDGESLGGGTAAGDDDFEPITDGDDTDDLI